jgi:hypothetical protein
MNVGRFVKIFLVKDVCRGTGRRGHELPLHGHFEEPAQPQFADSIQLVSCQPGSNRCWCDKLEQNVYLARTVSVELDVKL